MIHGPDGKDASVPAAEFNWDPGLDWKKLRVGYLKSEFDPPEPLKLQEAAANETADEKKKREEKNAQMKEARVRRDYDRRYELAALDKLRAIGVNLIPVALPKLPYDAMVPLLTAEAAAAFDDLTLSGRDSLLTEQGIEDWPNAFRIARFTRRSSTFRPTARGRWQSGKFRRCLSRWTLLLLQARMHN